MTALCTYHPDRLDTTIRNARTLLASDELVPAEVLQLVDRLLFRDEAGSYWTVDPLQMRWYRWQDERWQPTPAPQSSLEGPATLNAPVDPSRQEDSTEEAPLPEMTAAQAASALAQRLGTAYREGRITNDQAAELLGRTVLIDRQGTAWTPGVWSGRWYAFEEREWSAQDTAPIDDALLTRSELAGWAANGDGDSAVTETAAEALGAFLVRGAATLPEDVTAPWAPPETNSPLWMGCPGCTRLNLPGYRFCIWCGQEAPPLAESDSLSLKDRPSATAPALPAQEVACSQCGTRGKQGQAYCGRCGTALSAAQPSTPPSGPTSQICPRCATPTKPTDRFCGNCGALLT